MIRLISSWGNNAGGKSTIAVALATALARKNKNVLVIGNDMAVPTLPIYLPNKQFDDGVSIGRMMSRDIEEPNDIIPFIQLHPNSDNIGFIGTVSGENASTYDPVEHTKVIALLRALDSTAFDYAIFDCTSEPTMDGLTMSALRLSDFVVRTISPDIRGMEFEKSNRVLMENLDGLDFDNHIRIINNAHTYSPVDQIISVTGKVDCVLPSSKGIFNKVTSGQMIERTGDKQGIDFEKSIEKLVGGILKADEY